ncbi:MAG: glycosyltransferase family 39 protein [Thermoanaerobaculia bacterium]
MPPLAVRRWVSIAALLTLTAAVLRLYRLDHFSYWLDEILQARFVRGSWQEFWKTLRLDMVHPPLDYLIVRGVEHVDPADWVRKVPAVAWGIGTVAAFGALVGRRAGRGAARVAMLLLTFAPFHVRYSQELRPYSLGLFLLVLSLLLLESFLARPTPLRLLGLYLAALGCAYALYLAAAVLAIAAAALVAEDCICADPERRRYARRFLGWSPVFIAALWLAYLPWWPVLLEASRRPPLAGPEPLTLARLGRTISFFAFAPNDGHPLRRSGALAAILMATGLWTAIRRRRLRFLAIWAIAGLVTIEILGQVHPHFAATRRFLPAGIALTALVALAVADLLSRTALARIAGYAVLAVFVFFSAQGLATYYRVGRPDWRPLALFLRRESAPGETIFSENQYTMLCVKFYLRRGTPGENLRNVVSVDGDVRRLAYSWPPRSGAWLVLGCGPESGELRTWAKPFPTFAFPTAEGESVLKRLDAASWGEAMRRVR